LYHLYDFTHIFVGIPQGQITLLTVNNVI